MPVVLHIRVLDTMLRFLLILWINHFVRVIDDNIVARRNAIIRLGILRLSGGPNVQRVVNVRVRVAVWFWKVIGTSGCLFERRNFSYQISLTAVGKRTGGAAGMRIRKRCVVQVGLGGCCDICHFYVCCSIEAIIIAGPLLQPIILSFHPTSRPPYPSCIQGCRGLGTLVQHIVCQRHRLSRRTRGQAGAGTITTTSIANFKTRIHCSPKLQCSLTVQINRVNHRYSCHWRNAERADKSIVVGCNLPVPVGVDTFWQTIAVA